MQKKSIHVKIEDLPLLEKHGNAYLIQNIQDLLQKFKFSTEEQKDAMALAKSSTILEHPEIIDHIENYAQGEIFQLFEKVNLTLIESKGGFPIYQFGEWTTEFKDQDLFAGFIHAITSFFYHEIDLQFDTFTIESTHVKHGNVLFCYRNGLFLFLAVWNDRVAKDLGFSSASISTTIKKETLQFGKYLNSKQEK